MVLNTQFDLSQIKVYEKYTRKISEHSNYVYFIEYEIIESKKIKYRFYKKYNNIIFKYYSDWYIRKINSFENFIERDFAKGVKKIDENYSKEVKIQRDVSISTILFGVVILILI